MSRVLVIGCGGVASVAIQKCCQVDEVFTEMCIASRTKEKCDALVEKLKGKTKTVLTTAKVDADDVDQLIELINSYKPDLVMNIALPYQDLTIMDACLACGVGRFRSTPVSCRRASPWRPRVSRLMRTTRAVGVSQAKTRGLRGVNPFLSRFPGLSCFGGLTDFQKTLKKNSKTGISCNRYACFVI